MDSAEAENGGQQKPSIESQINARKLCQFLGGRCDSTLY